MRFGSNSTRFFDRVRAMTTRPPDSGRQPFLQAALAQRDLVTGGLAKGDSATVSAMQDLFQSAPAAQTGSKQLRALAADGHEGGRNRMKKPGMKEETMADLWSLRGLSWRGLAKRTCRKSRDDEVFGQAVRLAFYYFLSLFPVLLLLLILFDKLAGAGSTGSNLRDTLLVAFRQVCRERRRLP